MYAANRVIFSDNAVLSDISVAINDPYSGSSTLAVVATEDALFVGSELPFNQRHFEISSANALASTISVSLWDGSAFTTAVDVYDGTSVGGATLAQSGVIAWTLQKGNAWNKQDTDDGVTGLSSLKIYGLYWAKFTFSADLTATTALKFIGFKFSTDAEIGSLYPELALSGTKTQFASGKTDWFEQHIRASERIIRDLKKTDMGVIRDPNQLLDWTLFSEASIHMVANIVYTAFGDDYQDNRDQALKDYYRSLNGAQNSKTDKNGDTVLSHSEAFPELRVVRR